MSSTLTERAARSLGFTIDDLRANQQGELTERQRYLARTKYSERVSGSVFLILAPLLLCNIFVALGMGSDGTLSPSDQKVLFWILLPTIFLGVLCLYGVLQGRDLYSGRVASVDGQARTQIVEYRSRYRSSTGYELLIGGLRFGLTSESDFAAFESGARYRVYYIPYSPVNVLLSTEALDTPNGSTGI